MIFLRLPSYCSLQLCKVVADFIIFLSISNQEKCGAETKKQEMDEERNNQSYSYIKLTHKFTFYSLLKFF